jgi:hypothetical protein
LADERKQLRREQREHERQAKRMAVERAQWLWNNEQDERAAAILEEFDAFDD